MSEWQDRSEINGDVVFFNYADPAIEKSVREVFVWDIDKTYLDTKIDSLGGLLTTILERALNKKNVPGTKFLLQGLAAKASQGGEAAAEALFPIYFISASPPQMEERISEKFAIDGIHPMGCFFKDNLANLRPGRFSRLTRQVGYKLQALLQLRTRLGEDLRQICWGDDSESDAVIYNLYSDICARRRSESEIREILLSLNVLGDQVETILDLQDIIPVNDPVERIYINLATDTDPDYYLKFGQRTLATMTSFQAALDLYQRGKLDIETVYKVAEDMISNYHFSRDELTQSFEEILRRGVIEENSYEPMREYLIKKNILPSSFSPSLQVFKNHGMIQEPWIQPKVDYLNDMYR